MPEIFSKTGSHDEELRKIPCGSDRGKERVILVKNTECVLHNKDLLSREKKSQQNFIPSGGRALISL